MAFAYVFTMLFLFRDARKYGKLIENAVIHNDIKARRADIFYVTKNQRFPLVASAAALSAANSVEMGTL